MGDSERAARAWADEAASQGTVEPCAPAAAGCCYNPFALLQAGRWAPPPQPPHADPGGAPQQEPAAEPPAPPAPAELAPPPPSAPVAGAAPPPGSAVGSDGRTRVPRQELRPCLCFDWGPLHQMLAKDGPMRLPDHGLLRVAPRVASTCGAGEVHISSVALQGVWESLPLDEQSRDMARFSVGEGDAKRLYRFKTAPRGQLPAARRVLRLASDLAQQLQDQLPAGAVCAAVLDDLLIAAASFEAALHATGRIGKAVRAGGLGIDGPASILAPRPLLGSAPPAWASTWLERPADCPREQAAQLREQLVLACRLRWEDERVFAGRLGGPYACAGGAPAEVALAQILAGVGNFVAQARERGLLPSWWEEDHCEQNQACLALARAAAGRAWGDWSAEVPGNRWSRVELRWLAEAVLGPISEDASNGAGARPA